LEHSLLKIYPVNSVEAKKKPRNPAQTFLDLLDIKLPNVSLSDFWLSRGPVWDGLGISDSGKIFLVEAKSHIAEVLSPKTGAGESL
jgi:hypothetical protein